MKNDVSYLLQIFRIFNNDFRFNKRVDHVLNLHKQDF
jgi:hypothetical protein